MTLIAVMDPHVRAGKWRLQGGFRCANRGPGAVSIATIAAITTGSGRKGKITSGPTISCTTARTKAGPSGC